MSPCSLRLPSLVLKPSYFSPSFKLVLFLASPCPPHHCTQTQFIIASTTCWTTVTSPYSSFHSWWVFFSVLIELLPCFFLFFFFFSSALCYSLHQLVVPHFRWFRTTMELSFTLNITKDSGSLGFPSSANTYVKFITQLGHNLDIQS